VSRYLHLAWWVNEFRRARERGANRREHEAWLAMNFVCPHDGDYLCRKYGCPDDPSWKGDRK
jgi:hypothetical protein